MKTKLRIFVLATVCLLGVRTSRAQNLIPNPSFDTDLSSWVEAGPIEWSSQDADGSTHSGSVKITNEETGGFSGSGLFAPCLTIPAGTHISFGGKFLIPSGQADSDASGWIFVFWHSSSDCGAGSVVGTSKSSVTTTTGTWERVLADDVIAPDGALSAAFTAQIYTQSHPSPPLIGYFDDAFLVPGSVTASCVANDSTLCLNGGRYKVTARWRTHTDSGDGHAEALTSDTGTFWFFSSNNVELIAKVVSACVDPFNRYWVFAAGLTNVEVTITVVDTHSGEVRTYVNPLDQAFAPIQDTNAFATCP